MNIYKIKPIEWRDKSNAEKTEFDAFNIFGYYSAHEYSDRNGFVDDDYQYRACAVNDDDGCIFEGFNSQQEAQDWCENHYKGRVAKYLEEVYCQSLRGQSEIRPT